MLPVGSPSPGGIYVERLHSSLPSLRAVRSLLETLPLPEEELGPIKVRPVPTDYFSQEEFQKLVNVTHDLSHWSTNPGHRVRVRALLLLMRYSGLRLNDAVTLERARLTENRLFLYQQKTGLPVCIPLPPHVVELLHTLPNSNSRYFFWTGNGLHYRDQQLLARQFAAPLQVGKARKKGVPPHAPGHLCRRTTVGGRSH
jgi:integrase